ncbi:MAG: hypothetical protein NT018_12120 [Armatimonadetes bacterium]|nr:hypothetical protein [Armatimonadota bacterium]
MRKLILMTLMLMLTFYSASACLAVYPEPDGTACLQMFQGYVGGNLAWYVCTDTSNYRFSQTQNLTFAPKLDSAWGVAAPLYIVENPLGTQGPIFSAKPGDANYSGIWTVVYVKWIDESAKTPLISEDQIFDAETAGDLTVTPSDPHNVVDYPIVILGSLASAREIGLGHYIIPQFIDIYKRKITLPTFNVSCSDGTTMEPFIKKIIITDVGDEALATSLGANLAPGLLDIDALNKQAFWVRRGPKPPSEVPIIEFCPDNYASFNAEKEYTPVMQYTILHSFIAPSTQITNKNYLKLLIGNGGLVIAQSDQVINAPVLPAIADVVVCSRCIKVYLFDWFIADNDRINLSFNGLTLLTDFKLPWLIKPKCLELCLNPGDNVIEISALTRGKWDSCTIGIFISDACPGYINFLKGSHLELFGLTTGECAKINIRYQ